VISTRIVPPPLEAARFSSVQQRHIAPPLFADPARAPIELRARGVLLVTTSDERPFATRLESLRVVAGAPATRVLHRRARDADTHEVLGGLGSPMVRVAGSTQLVLGVKPGQAIVLLRLEDELAFIREDALLGFELCLGYENGRLALEAPGDGLGLVPNDGTREGGAGPPLAVERVGAHVVQLRGTGMMALDLPGELTSIPCTAGRALLVRREWIVGWLGRLVPRPLPSAESPSGQRGLIAFSGEGTVVVCAG
jgi:hypothetical protein